MEIITIGETNYINYLLYSIKFLAGENNPCNVSTLITHCSGKSFGAQIVNYRTIIKYSNQLGFIAFKDGGIILTDIGIDFVCINKQNLFEVSEEQKIYFAEKIVFDGKWQAKARRFFSIFISNYEEVTYESKLRKEEIPLDLKPFLYLLLDLGVIDIIDNDIKVTPYYVKHVRDLRTFESGISQRDLELLNEEKRESGAHAEELVVKYEQKRLRNLGLFAEADRVYRIGELDVTKGYDVLSFNGDKPTLEHNRFIEVKSLRGNEIKFFWSKGQIEKAQIKGESYWVYFISGISEKTTVENLKILKVNDPYTKIFISEDWFSTDVDKLSISGKSKLETEFQNVNDMEL